MCSQNLCLPAKTWKRPRSVRHQIPSLDMFDCRSSPDGRLHIWTTVPANSDFVVYGQILRRSYIYHAGSRVCRTTEFVFDHDVLWSRASCTMSVRPLWFGCFRSNLCIHVRNVSTRFQKNYESHCDVKFHRKSCKNFSKQATERHADVSEVRRVPDLELMRERRSIREKQARQGCKFQLVSIF